MKPWNVTRNALRTMGGAAGASMGKGAAKRGGTSGPVIRRVANAWRAQTGGAAIRDGNRKTLLACSGGADSTALAIALCAGVSDAGSRFVVGHVVHDLRAKKEALADRDHAKKLAKWLRVPFCEAKVVVKGAARRGLPGSNARLSGEQSTKNLEAAARVKRYEALLALAKKHGCDFVATAHHLDDALETVLMRLMRGCGPRAMRGVMPVRRVKVGKHTCTVVRPMLGFEVIGIEGLTRAECETLCNAAEFSWRHDVTNDDTTRLRAAIRKSVVPALRAIDAGAARRVVRSAGLCAEAGEMVRRRAKVLLRRAELGRNDGKTRKHRQYSRELLAKASATVLNEAIALLVHDVGGKNKRDRVRVRSVGEVAKMITDNATHPRRVVVGGCGVMVDVRRVVVQRMK